MADLSLSPIIPNDGQLVISDGAGSPLTYTVVYEDGDFSYSGVKKGQKAVQKFQDRGRDYAWRETSDEDIEVSFSCHCVAFGGDGSTTTTPNNVFEKTGTWASATSMLPAAAGGGSSGVWAVKLVFTAERSNNGATADSTVTFKYFHCEDISFTEGSPSKLSFKGKVLNYSTDYYSTT